MVQTFKGILRLGRDRPRHQKVAFIASSEGGMDIEEVAHSTPDKIKRSLWIRWPV